METIETSFLPRLHEEKLASQARRGTLITRKLSWVTGLVAVGWVQIGNTLDLWPLLFLVPFVALLFDLYIAGENYGIKRMGVFVREYFASSIDGKWERFVKPKRDKFSEYALPIGSCIVLIASLGGLLGAGQSADRRPRWLGEIVGVWFIVALALIWAVHFLSAWRLRKIDTQVLADPDRVNQSGSST